MGVGMRWFLTKDHDSLTVKSDDEKGVPPPEE